MKQKHAAKEWVMTETLPRVQRHFNGPFSKSSQNKLIPRKRRCTSFTTDLIRFLNTIGCSLQIGSNTLTKLRSQQLIYW